MTKADIRGGEGLVKPWVQACADAIITAIPEANSFGTYPGHDPDLTLATDVFVPVNSLFPGTEICNFLIPNFKQFSIRYIIFRQRIYNPEIGDYWRNMEDRGSPTQNHMDHVHISFYETGPDTPPDHQEKDDMFTDDDRQLLADVNEVLNNTEVGVLKRVADVESGIQNIFLTFQRVEKTLARIEQHQNEIPPPQNPPPPFQ